MGKSLVNIFLLVSIPLMLFSGCMPRKNTKDGIPGPKGYDLSRPEKFNMPGSLLEISGIAFYKGRPDTLYAIQDEEGKLFRLKPGLKEQKNVRFASRGDYEDVAILAETVFVLKSNGHLYSFPFIKATAREIDDTRVWKKMLAKGEYEGMFADDSEHQLYVLCKSCGADQNKATVSGSIFKYDEKADSLYLNGSFSINMEDIRKLEPGVKKAFKPSAIARNPLSKQWFIVSSVNKLLVIANPDWKVTEVYKLNASDFNQPEGIAFDTSGNLYVSNEGDEFNEGNVLKFTYHTSK